MQSYQFNINLFVFYLTKTWLFSRALIRQPISMLTFQANAQHSSNNQHLITLHSIINQILDIRRYLYTRVEIQTLPTRGRVGLSHWAHDVVATLNQRH